jgi:hypothetical protein
LRTYIRVGVSFREFIRFLRRIERIVQKHLDVHLVLDNSSTHKTA